MDETVVKEGAQIRKPFVIPVETPIREWTEDEGNILQKANERLDSGLQMSPEQTAYYIYGMYSNSNIPKDVFKEKRPDNPRELELVGKHEERVRGAGYLEKSFSKQYSMMYQMRWERTFNTDITLDRAVLKGFGLILLSRVKILEDSLRPFLGNEEETNRRKMHIQSLNSTLSVITKMLKPKDD